LLVSLQGGSEIGLADPAACVGLKGDAASPEAILLKRHGLHMEIQIDRNHAIGKSSPAGIKDVLMESALSTIQDCEDSVAAVDAEDKVLVYRNWLGLMKGDLKEEFEKGGKKIVRKLNPDRQYQSLDGSSMTLAGRSLSQNNTALKKLPCRSSCLLVWKLHWAWPPIRSRSASWMKSAEPRLI